jgi:hypothetical protein
VDDGYIKLHRKLLDSYIAAMPPGQRWVALTIFLMANWQDRKWVLNGKVVPVHRGEFVTSVRRLAEAAGVSNSCVVRALKVLKDGGTIGVKPEQRCTRITVLNFARYNDRDSEGETIAERQRDDSGTIASDNRRREEGKKGRKKTPLPPKGEVAEATQVFTASFNRFFDRHTRGGNGTQALVRKALKRGYTPEHLKAACWAARSKCDGAPEVLENFEPKSILRLSAREGMSLPDWLEKADELWAEKYPDKPPTWEGTSA